MTLQVVVPDLGTVATDVVFELLLGRTDVASTQFVQHYAAILDFQKFLTVLSESVMTMASILIPRFLSVLHK